MTSYAIPPARDNMLPAPSPIPPRSRSGRSAPLYDVLQTEKEQPLASLCKPPPSSKQTSARCVSIILESIVNRSNLVFFLPLECLTYRGSSKMRPSLWEFPHKKHPATLPRDRFKKFGPRILKDGLGCIVCSTHTRTEVTWGYCVEAPSRKRTNPCEKSVEVQCGRPLGHVRCVATIGSEPWSFLH
jgi:hypothetical protein